MGQNTEGKFVKHTAYKFISDALVPELFVKDVNKVECWTTSCIDHI